MASYTPPTLHEKRLSFLVKGVQYPHADHSFPLVQLLLPYFKSRENLVVITDAFDQNIPAFECIGELLSQENDTCFWVVADGTRTLPKYKYLQTYTPSTLLYSTEAHLILDRTLSPAAVSSIISSSKAPHICILLNYSDMEKYRRSPSGTPRFNGKNRDWLKNILDDVSATVGLPRTGYTFVGTIPPSQTVRFIFAQNEEMKIKSVQLMKCPPGTLVYWPGWPKSKMAAVILEGGLSNCRVVGELTDDLVCTRLIIIKPDPDSLREIIKRFHDIAIFYSIEEFGELEKIMAVCDDAEIPVPEHIRRMGTHQPSG